MKNYRNDIDGLRAIAVLLVVAFHVGLPFFDTGFVGVDVFFVLSGFLITGILSKEADDRGTVRLGRFYTRRLRRLLPASSITVLITMLASFFLVSALSWRQIAESAAAAALYASNLFFAQEANDYFAADAESNPLLHFWSLAVEEQFYIVWPLLILGLSKFGSRVRLGGLVVLTIASFTHSVVLTNAATPWAYYSPLSRAWEFALGGILALALPAGLSKMSKMNREIVAWSGLALIFGSLVLITSTTPFPGVAAVPTVVGTCMTIAAMVDDEGPLGRILLSWPFQQLGALSYSWYLWHWPFLVIGQLAFGSTSPVLRIGLASASLIVAAASYHLVEKRVRFAPKLTASHGPNWAMAGITIVALLGASFALNQRAEAELASAELADLVVARDDLPALTEVSCDVGSLVALLELCSGGSDTASQTVLVLGDSHAEMWTPTLDALSADLDFRYVLHILGGCNVVGTQPPISVEACRRVQDQNLEIIDELQPDAVIVSHYATNVDDAGEDQWVAGLASFLDDLDERDITVGWIHDSPSFSEDPVECVARRSEAECIESVEDATALSIRLREREAPTLEAFDAVTIDPTIFMCDDETCALRSDGVFTFRDAHHVAATHAEALAPEFRSFVADVLAAS